MSYPPKYPGHVFRFVGQLDVQVPNWEIFLHKRNSCDWSGESSFGAIHSGCWILHWSYHVTSRCINYQLELIIGIWIEHLPLISWTDSCMSFLFHPPYPPLLDSFLDIKQVISPSRSPRKKLMISPWRRASVERSQRIKAILKSQGVMIPVIAVYLSTYIYIWVFPKILVPPNHQF